MTCGTYAPASIPEGGAAAGVGGGVSVPCGAGVVNVREVVGEETVPGGAVDVVTVVVSVGGWSGTGGAGGGGGALVMDSRTVVAVVPLTKVFLLLAILAHVKVVDNVEEVLHHRHLFEANSIVSLRILDSAGLDVDVWIRILVRVIVEGRGRCELGDDGILHAPIEVAWRRTDPKPSSLHPQLEFGSLVINVISAKDLKNPLVFIARYCLGLGRVAVRLKDPRLVSLIHAEAGYFCRGRMELPFEVCASHAWQVRATSWSQHEPRGAAVPLPRGAFLYLHLMNHLDGVGLRGGYWGGPAGFRPPGS